MSCSEADLTIEQGATFTVVFVVEGIDLSSGWTARMQGRELFTSATTVFSLTTGGGGMTIAYDGTDTNITATIAAATTTGFKAPNEGVWDMEYTDGTVVHRGAEGRFYVTPEVTR